MTNLHRADEFPTQFRRPLISSRTTVIKDGKHIPIRVTIYRPFSTGEVNYWTSFRVYFGGRVVSEGSGPGTDAITSLFQCLVQLAVELERLRATQGFSWIGHEMWWIRHLLGQ